MGLSRSAGAAAIDAVHTSGMPRGRTWRWLVPGVALLACAGVWLGHTLEYVRAWGWSGLDRELAGSVHLYMVPVGVALVLLMAIAGLALARLHRLLTRRVELASGLLARVWRGRVELAQPSPTAAHGERLSLRRTFLLLGTSLALLQVGLYFIQENAESALAGIPAPGLSAISGVHWPAPLIQAAVGFLVAAVVVALWSLVRRREAVAERIERVLRGVLAALVALRVRPLPPQSGPLRHHGAPSFLGASIWCRPPPLALIP